MKLHELKSVGGTYVAVVPTAATQALLQAWAAENSVTLDDELHTTVLYSRVPLAVQPCTDEFQAKFTGFKTLGDKIVALLDCQALIARHEQFIAQGGTHDFKSYIPHISLFDANLGHESLAPIGFGMILGMEYSEPLEP